MRRLPRPSDRKRGKKRFSEAALDVPLQEYSFGHMLKEKDQRTCASSRRCDSDEIDADGEAGLRESSEPENGKFFTLLTAMENNGEQ